MPASRRPASRPIPTRDLSPTATAIGREEQIEVMVAATRCQNENGAIQALFDLQSRYEAAYVDEYGDEMERHRARLDEIADRLSNDLERVS